ncbi:glutaredoxin family protein [Sediminibacillus halophilus]|uniref:Glutaredoxin n=1 Tax=Sediminibacillus halophilus TaxID=482461 RepID=A0A1G9QZT1_9BACI|nr:glutaredoxin family protein [Sediminibacillus halophilus]SDM16519.1 Glutaredoxin [Sediminibacillus halophilus]
MKQVVKIYTKAACQESQSLKEFLSKDQVPYVEVDITESEEKQRQLQSAAGTNLVPTIVIEQEGLIGKKKNIIYTGFTNNKEEIDRTIKH